MHSVSLGDRQLEAVQRPIEEVTHEKLPIEQASIHCWHSLVHHSSSDVSICQGRLLYCWCDYDSYPRSSGYRDLEKKVDCILKATLQAVAADTWIEDFVETGSGLVR
jgi:hypothetical protein